MSWSDVTVVSPVGCGEAASPVAIFCPKAQAVTPISMLSTAETRIAPERPRLAVIQYAETSEPIEPPAVLMA